MLERWSGIWYNGRESGHGKRSAPPARETASLTPEKPAGPGQRTEKGADGMERYRVLLVDDEEEIRAGISRKIDWDSLGFTLAGEADNGEEALELAELVRPDVVLTDIKMPFMDGLELCRRIKENRQTSEIPVIFATAETAPEVITAGFDAGCCDYVPKPFVRAEYLARISAHLRIARQNKALRTAYEELDRFCSAVSHDLKSPLSVMRMLLSMLKDELGDSVPDEAAHILGILDGKAELLTAMVERLLEFSRMCSIRPNMVPLDMGTLLHEVYDEQRLAEPERQVELEMEPLLTVHGLSLIHI